MPRFDRGNSRALFRSTVTHRVLHRAFGLAALVCRGFALDECLAFRCAQIFRDGPAEAGGRYPEVPIHGGGHALVMESTDNLTELLRCRRIVQIGIAPHVDPSA